MNENEVVPGLGEAILYRRELNRLTQQELAERLGSKNVYICYIERGARTPSLPFLSKLVKELDTSLAQVFADAARFAADRDSTARHRKKTG